MSHSNNDARRGGSMKILRVHAIGLTVILVAFSVMPAISMAADMQSPNCKTDAVRSTYLLGSEDELQFTGPEPDEALTAPKIFRVDGEGDSQVPLVGRVHVAG